MTMPDGKACVLSSANEGGGVPSAKRRFPLPSRTGLTSRTTSSASPCLERYSRGPVQCPRTGLTSPHLQQPQQPPPQVLERVAKHRRSPPSLSSVNSSRARCDSDLRISR